MTEVPIQISGVLYDKTARTQQSVVLMGKASIMGLSVGGGPIVLPPDPPPVEGQPPGQPTFPIWGPPGVELPPGSGYPPVAGHPLPPGTEPPKPIDNWEAKAFWTPATGWGVVIVPVGDQPIPTPSKR